MLAEEIHLFLDDSMVLPEEKKRCRKKLRGNGDLLCIDKTVLKEVRRKNKNLTKAWINCCKAYDMISHLWILECLQDLGIGDGKGHESAGWKEKIRRIGRGGGGCCVEPPANPCVSRENDRKTTVVVVCCCKIWGLMKK